jgi:hypothetical protein
MYKQYFVCRKQSDMFQFICVIFRKSYLTYSMMHSPSWEANRFAVSQEIPHIFMEPEGSLPHSQMPATCPYPEPSRSSHIPKLHFLAIHLNVILPANVWVSPVLSFPQCFPLKPSICLSSHSRYMPNPSHSSRFYCPNLVSYRDFRTTVR